MEILPGVVSVIPLEGYCGVLSGISKEIHPQVSSEIPPRITSVVCSRNYSGGSSRSCFWLAFLQEPGDSTWSSSFLPEDPSGVPSEVLSWIPLEVPSEIHSEVSQ